MKIKALALVATLGVAVALLAGCASERGRSTPTKNGVGSVDSATPAVPSIGEAIPDSAWNTYKSALTATTTLLAQKRYTELCEHMTSSAINDVANGTNINGTCAENAGPYELARWQEEGGLNWSSSPDAKSWEIEATNLPDDAGILADHKSFGSTVQARVQIFADEATAKAKVEDGNYYVVFKNHVVATTFPQGVQLKQGTGSGWLVDNFTH